jgi:3-oxoacyl-[acyl-carrier protein] reductase
VPVAVVTGVSRRAGIGFAVARRLASDGFSVMAHHWSAHDALQPWGADPLGGEGVVEALRASVPGASIASVEADFLDPSAPSMVVDAAVAAFGRVDVLVANHARSSRQSLSTLTASEVDASMAVNVRATLLLVQAFATQFGSGGGGRVVWFTSGQHKGPMPGEVPYVASKAALHGLAATVAAELEPLGIDVHCIDPGPTDTGWPAAMGVTVDERFRTPDDVAGLVAGLCSGEART